jgi:electron transport complex protein RnfB
MNARVQVSADRPTVAVIDEARCIGCTLCIQACPVDAIVGARRLMHTVIANACTGCELCIPPCPVDCIVMVGTAQRDEHAKRAAADAARRRSEARNVRLARLREEARERKASRRDDGAERRKKETIAKAIERARQRLAARSREG